ncbi:hypothetical protein [Pleomorphomonas sp. PLEO]|uniref:hypothetical protein n=1 Tax=Pleomorphomonas sp. PLEO TaxID=3239306 RepID=UPI00351F294A
MTVYESQLTEGNLKNYHIYITAILGHLTPPASDPSPDAPAKAKPMPKSIRLEFNDLKVNAEIPKSRHGRPRKFFREHGFVKSFFERTGAVVGDTVLFEEVVPAHYRLSLRKAAVS